jgi:FkbM family methyltransferase
MNINKKYNLEYRQSKNFPGKDFLWPAEDSVTWKQFAKTGYFEGVSYLFYDFPNVISQLLPENKKNLVIQAGGNGGIYPWLYSKTFKEVVTFEPVPRWFMCLDKNIPETNVKKFNSAIGNSEEPITMVINTEIARGDKNLGAMRVELGGEIPQIKIDSLNLAPDLIHLDIEGFEGEALLGARATIEKFKPIIVVETNDCGDKYGWPKQRLHDLIISFGYKVLIDWDHDIAYCPVDC